MRRSKAYPVAIVDGATAIGSGNIHLVWSGFIVERIDQAPLERRLSPAPHPGIIRVFSADFPYMAPSADGGVNRTGMTRLFDVES